MAYSERGGGHHTAVTGGILLTGVDHPGFGAANTVFAVRTVPANQLESARPKSYPLGPRERSGTQRGATHSGSAELPGPKSALELSYYLVATLLEHDAPSTHSSTKPA